MDADGSANGKSSVRGLWNAIAVEMNASAFNNHWRRLAMTGGGTAPKAFEKEEDLRKFVSETPGAIGFVDAANADASVAILTPRPKL